MDNERFSWVKWCVIPFFLCASFICVAQKFVTPQGKCIELGDVLSDKFKITFDVVEDNKLADWLFDPRVSVETYYDTIIGISMDSLNSLEVQFYKKYFNNLMGSKEGYDKNNTPWGGFFIDSLFLWVDSINGNYAELYSFHNKHNNLIYRMSINNYLYVDSLQKARSKFEEIDEDTEVEIY